VILNGQGPKWKTHGVSTSQVPQHTDKTILATHPTPLLPEIGCKSATITPGSGKLLDASISSGLRQGQNHKEDV